MKSVVEYTTSMGACSKWCGLIEILLFSRSFRGQVQVYVKRGGSFALAYSVGSRASATTRIVFDGQRYEA